MGFCSSVHQLPLINKKENLKSNRLGVAYGVGAYVIWGLLPIYWRWLEQATAFEILANRGIWSLVVCMILLAFQRQLRSTFTLMKNYKTFFTLALSSFLLTLNWGIYIWSVSADRVVEASLGYYITPLVVVFFGVFVLKEKLRNTQKLSLGLAAIGVAILTFAFGQLPLVAFGLALSWGAYSLIKKRLAESKFLIFLPWLTMNLDLVGQTYWMMPCATSGARSSWRTKLKHPLLF